MLQKAAVIAAAPSDPGMPKGYQRVPVAIQSRFLGWQVFFHSKYMVMCTYLCGESFKMAYVYRRQPVFADVPALRRKYIPPPLTMEHVSKYEEWNHGASESNWSRIPKTQAGLARLEKELAKRLNIMQV